MGSKEYGEHYDCIDVPGDNYLCGEMENNVCGNSEAVTT